MVASTATKEGSALNNIYPVNSFGVKELLKSAAIFGANGAGKSNLVTCLQFVKSVVCSSLSFEKNLLAKANPFFLKEDPDDLPTEFEISFLADGNLYRYGLSFRAGIIEEEWLYWTKSSRETQLFHRNRQNVIYNQRSFKEAKMFVKKVGDSLILQKTKPNIPFISVLTQFEGERSQIVYHWFNSLLIYSGVNPNPFRKFTTINLFHKNSEFKIWAMKILKAIQIDDIRTVEFEKPEQMSSPKFRDVNKALERVLEDRSKLPDFKGEELKGTRRLEVIKHIDGEDYSIPLSSESDGTQKLIYMLGPLFNVIKNNEVLIIDEFENKFHTLLAKYMISIYNQSNHGQSQLILTCHDTNLLTKELFRRDQIWFVERNLANESRLYSLVEYKEHYTRQDQSYSKDYLLGKYGAVPLFSSTEELGDVFDE